MWTYKSAIHPTSCPSGTTVKGAVDDLDLILKVLERVGYTEDRFYIHVDGALFGLMMPFVKKVSTLNISEDVLLAWVN